MAKVEHPLQALRNYLPDGSFEPVVQLINKYKEENKNLRDYINSY